jgi:hypothetical protein
MSGITDPMLQEFSLFDVHWYVSSCFVHEKYELITMMRIKITSSGMWRCDADTNDSEEPAAKSS